MRSQPIAAATVFLGLGLAGCDTLDCGPGTHRTSDECVPNVQVACGPGTRFEDGRCVAVAGADAGPDGGGGGGLTCGPGTERRGDQCVPVEGPDRDGGPLADTGPRRDLGPPDDALIAEGGPPDDGSPPDATPDAAPPPPACPPDLEPGVPPDGGEGAPPGSYCVVGVARDFVTNCALPADADLLVLLIDPIAAATGAAPEQYTRGVGQIGPGGAFSVFGVDSSQALALVIDENPRIPDAVDAWARSVSGVSAEASQENETYRVTAFASSVQAEARWSRALGLEPGELLATGFLIGRVLTPGEDGLVPLAGAEVRGTAFSNLAGCVAGQPCLRFFGDDPRLTALLPAGTRRTGASVAFLLARPPETMGALQDRFFVADPADTYPVIAAGANPGSGFHIVFVPLP